MLVPVWQQYTLCGKPCTSLFLSLFFESETANTTLAPSPDSRAGSWQNIPVRASAPLTPTHLHSASPEKVGSFPGSCGGARGLFSVPWALAVCSQVGVAEPRLGLSQGSGVAVEGRNISVWVLSNIPQVATVTQPELTQMDQRSQQAKQPGMN